MSNSRSKTRFNWLSGFTQAEILDLLQHHRNLTGTRLILTSVDYDVLVRSNLMGG